MELQDRHIEFLQLVKRAAFSNPFGEERDLLDMKIAGLEKFNSRQDLLRLMVEKLNEIMQRYDSRGTVTLQVFNNEHRELIRTPLLFYIFHRYIERMDEFIVRQEQHGVETIAVPWADELIDEMRERGISLAEAEWSFGLFYQLRRAFFFIHKEIKGEAASIRQLRMRLWNNIFSYDTELYVKYLWNQLEDYSTLILGETGTGKSRAARAIGCSGFIPFNGKTRHFAESFVSAFVSINLSQFPESIIESELFGHKKGAFTGAIANQEGIFGSCSSYGAIFLDEIAEISIPIQIKLLQVLQERVYYPVGSREAKYFKGRVIAATNQDLLQHIQNGQFRQDFYYRLCSDVITVPPLAQRIKEDKNELKMLTTVLLRRLVGEGAETLNKDIETKIIKTMGWDYSWTGNVREFEQCIRSLLISGAYVAKDIAVAAEGPEFAKQFNNGEFLAEQLLGIYCQGQYDKLKSYEKVATKIGLDRRTVKKYIELNSD